MDRHTLEKKIMRMERELLALKTACERGLGAISFYRTTKSVYVAGREPAYIKITVKVADGETMPTFMQLSSNQANALQFPLRVAVDNAGRVYTWVILNALNAGVGKNLDLECISGAKIASLNVEFTNEPQ